MDGTWADVERPCEVSEGCMMLVQVQRSHLNPKLSAGKMGCGASTPVEPPRTVQDGPSAEDIAAQQAAELMRMDEHRTEAGEGEAVPAPASQAAAPRMTSVLRSQQKLTITALKTLFEEDPEKIASVFAEADADGSGDLTFEEWERAFSADEAMDTTALRSFFDECNADRSGKVSLEQFKEGLKSVQSVGKLDMIKGVMNKINFEDIFTTALGNIVQKKRPDNDKLLPMDPRDVLKYITREDYDSVWRETVLPKIQEVFKEQDRLSQEESQMDVKAFNNKFSLSAFEGKFADMKVFLAGGKSSSRCVVLVYGGATSTNAHTCVCM